MKKYPKGAINQHKLLATGQPLRKCNKTDKGGDMNLKGGKGKGGTVSSSGTTGSPVGGGKVPASTTVPDKKGPVGHSVPKSTMTNW